MFKKRFELLTDAQWSLIEPLLPEPKRRKDNRGRPWASNRACLEGILWVLRTGAALSGRQFCTCEKGGFAVGKTKRGRQMAFVDVRSAR